MEDTWVSRDLPVLEAVVSQIDELPRTNSYPEAVDIADCTGMQILDVAPEARRAVGQWPTGQSLIERLAAGISQAAEHEKNPERKRRLLSVARELGGAVKAIAINVASEILEHRPRH